MTLAGFTGLLAQLSLPNFKMEIPLATWNLRNRLGEATEGAEYTKRLCKLSGARVRVSSNKVGLKQESVILAAGT